ncbi:MAG TPA: fibronectin/fibrinogen-binding protein [Firmicutes bacterium]|nr:fibronectin/fibrinogen-binding protein [Bacillota bacterium]
MPFDGLMLAAVRHEITPKITKARIARIYQPDPTTVVLGLRWPDEEHQLLISTAPNQARIHLVHQPFEPSIFAFGQSLRKSLIGGQVIEIKQPDWDRLLYLTIETEEGLLELIAEIMGRHSNLVLVDARTKKILAAQRVVTEQMSRYRQIAPGLRYIQPPASGRRPFYPLTREALANVLNSPKQVANTLLQGLLGLSPLLVTEILHRSGIEPTTPAQALKAEHVERLLQELTHLGQRAAQGSFTPTLITDGQGLPADISATNLKHLDPAVQKPFPSPSLLVSEYFHFKTTREAMAQLENQLNAVIQQQLANCNQKVVELEEALHRAESADEFRKYGELLTANLHALKRGQREATVIDYYDPEQRETTIELDPELTPAANADKYFRMYQKARRGRRITAEQLSKVNEEIQYLQTVETHLELAEDLEDLERIRDELMEQGYLPKPSERTKTGKKAQPLIFRGPEEVPIHVGRNNRENDQLTLRLARPHDLWFHTKQIPGSHVVVRMERKVGDLADVPEQLVRCAAQIAAYFSKARHGQNVPVDYTFIKYVRKPSGARPGFVIYDHYRTIQVDPKLPERD